MWKSSRKVTKETLELVANDEETGSKLDGEDITDNGYLNQLHTEDEIHPFLPVKSNGGTGTKDIAVTELIELESANQPLHARDIKLTNKNDSTPLRRAKSVDSNNWSCQVNRVVRVNSLRTLAPPIQRDDTQTDNPIGSYIQRLNTQLLNAVEEQNIEEVMRLMEAGASPNATCRRRHVSACHVAALRGGAALARLLAAGGALRPDRAGATPTHLAAWAGNHRQIAVLLHFPKDLQTQVWDGDVSIETERQIKQLIKHIPSIQKMVNAVCEPGTEEELPRSWMDGISHLCQDFDKKIPLLDPKWTPLHAASFHARAHCVRLLLAAGANPDAKDLKGHIPLEVAGCAIQSGHAINAEEFTETIQFLVKALNKNNELHIQGDKTYSPIHAAVEVGSLEAMRLLLDGGVKLHLFEGQQTPMHLCVQKQLKEHLQLLADHFYTRNSSLIDCQDNNGLTVLHASVRSDWMPGIRIALAAGADITIVADGWDTALHEATSDCKLNILDELLEYAKIRDVVDCVNHSEQTALFVAVIKGHLECVKKLLNNGASIHYRLPNKATVLHKAVEKGHLEILKYFFDTHPTAANDMINYQANVTFLNSTPLYIAIFKQKPEFVKFLLSKNADVHLMPEKSTTPLNSAVKHDNLEIANLILEFDKSALNSSQDTGFDALQSACFHSSKKCIKMLLQRGADLSKPTRENETAFNLIMLMINKPTEFMEEIFNSYIDYTDLGSRLEIDYRILLPNDEDTEQMKVVETLRSTGNRYGQKRLLLHPFILSFLYLKWKALLPCFYTIIALYSLYLTSFTVLIMSVFSYNKGTDAPDWMNTTIWSCLVYFFVSLLVILEVIYTMNMKSKTYFRHVETWVKFSSIALGIILAPALALVGSESEWLRHLSTVALLVSWMQMMFLLSRFSNWGYYFLIFGMVAFKIMRILITFLFLIIGFSLGFMIEFQFGQPFNNVWSAIVKTLVMMTSEFDFGDLYGEKHSIEPSSVISQIVFIVFIIFMAIVLMNLMTGVAVDDVQNLKFAGNINRVEKRIDLLGSLISLVNSKMIHKVLPRCISTRLLQRNGRISKSLNIKGQRSVDYFRSHLMDALIDIAVSNKQRTEDNSVESFCKYGSPVKLNFGTKATK